MWKESSVVATMASLQRPDFMPYQNNGGTVVAIGGEDYCIVSATTRLGLGFAIPTRNVCRYSILNNRVVLATAGMFADTATLHKVIKARVKIYEEQQDKPFGLHSAAQLLSNTLYYRRFFPYYTFNVLGGLDEDGQGFVYGFDAIGSGEKVKVVCNGTGQALIQPILDNQVEKKQQYENKQITKLSLQEAVDLIKDVFTSAGERDIYTGDAIDICIITKEKGVLVETFQLKQD
ncbi:Proteasome subunit beta type-1 [Galdieria sulphuraria]|uniref:20S proteasome subunit beta 6 n=1 Tax=Galdieria sulphuraria TaxID=130081 RepID=M2XYW6_GALSU|nr:20S proteasome subunit beta 6 [Galdieria sulphuraria]EME28754.1 20S proteasome subunit beta 6 [Galdieria sulphuraria]GJD07099.1 Proteasome subunit beta type-1 [Galdieria sulphuraria]|eukprot:XP_005705274.1 20S proteasome subunit beta 6 [Galdieria sulphuraria]